MELSAEEIHTVLERSIGNKNYEFVSCERIEDKGYVPIGFLSLQTKFTLKYKVNGQLRELHLFVKTLPETNFHKNLVTESKAFSKEVLIFEKFLLDLTKKVKGNPFPTCYLAKDNDKIVLNDLSILGFKNVPLMEFFTKDHCEKAIDSIVKFHAGALGFEKRHMCKIGEHFPLLMFETIFTDSREQMSGKSVQEGVKTLREVQKKYLPHYPEELANRVFEYLSSVGKLIGPSKKYLNVLSHSDLWASNLMFRSEEGKVQECCILDFQLASVRPLPYDMLMVLYLCSNRELRDKHYDHLVKYYYNNLSEALREENVNLTEILTWKDYECLLEEVRPIVLSLCPQFCHFVLMPRDIIKEVMKDDKLFHEYYIDMKVRLPRVLRAIEEYPAYKSRVLNALAEVFEYFTDHPGAS